MFFTKKMLLDYFFKLLNLFFHFCSHFHFLKIDKNRMPHCIFEKVVMSDEKLVSNLERPYDAFDVSQHSETSNHQDRVSSCTRRLFKSK